MSLTADLNYMPTDDEPFMNERQKAYFRSKLVSWKGDILRESALYELGMGLPRTEPLLLSILERTSDEGSLAIARQLLRSQRITLLSALAERWERWVAALPLGWLDRLLTGR